MCHCQTTSRRDLGLVCVSMHDNNNYGEEGEREVKWEECEINHFFHFLVS